MPPDGGGDATVQRCLDRARVYRGLAQLFGMPDAGSLQGLRERSLPELRRALERLAGDGELVQEASALCALFGGVEADELVRGHHAAFDESSGTRCAPTEMDQLGGIPQLELTRTFELADVAGFYKAFGVQVGAGDERVDHITAELEFMNLLAVKESIALQEEGEGEHAQICRDASCAFLRDHLARWAPRLGARLVATGADPVYSAAGRLLGDFIAYDAAALGADPVAAPIDVAADS